MTMQNSIKKSQITFWLVDSLIAAVTTACKHSAEIRQIESFDLNWRFYAGEITDAENPQFNDSAWLKVDVPQDWSIEGLAYTEVSDAPEFKVVNGEWKFSKGDNLLWKEPDFKDVSWQTVKLPSTWE